MLLIDASTVLFFLAVAGLLAADSSSVLGFAPTPPKLLFCNQQRLLFRHTISLPSTNSNDDVGSNDVSKDVQVYDDVFSPLACDEIHDLAVEHSFRGNCDTGIFVRPPYNLKPLTPLEHVMDSALTALNDPCRTVEYWSREEYMNIDAHCDIDENELGETARLRCPQFAHVLYLKVKADLKGPTCVFPGKRVGWNTTRTTDLVTVPAVQGRLLKFPGSAMHAVPRPPHRWLLSDEEEQRLRVEDDADEYEDDDEDDEDDVERSVLLFNTWPDDGPPPRGVKRDHATSGIPDGIELDDDTTDYLEAQEAQRLAEWEEDYGANAELIRCNARSRWSEACLTEGATLLNEASEKELQQNHQVRVNLMGRRNRRLHPENTARLDGPMDELRGGLEQETTATIFHLVDRII